MAESIERNPLVTCLCLTMKGREKFLERAIDCFWKQTYLNSELLIVYDMDHLRFGDEIFPERIRQMATFQGITVGEKRNAGCEAARGSIIAIWDDDDFYAPQRLDFQVGMLECSRGDPMMPEWWGKQVTGVRACKFTDGKNWWKFPSYDRDGFPISSSLTFRKAYWENHHFEELQVGQDEKFSNQAYENGVLIESPDMDLMYATIHEGNTSPRRVGEFWEPLPGFEWPK